MKELNQSDRTNQWLSELTEKKICSEDTPGDSIDNYHYRSIDFSKTCPPVQHIGGYRLEHSEELFMRTTRGPIQVVAKSCDSNTNNESKSAGSSGITTSLNVDTNRDVSNDKVQYSQGNDNAEVDHIGNVLGKLMRNDVDEVDGIKSKDLQTSDCGVQDTLHYNIGMGPKSFDDPNSSDPQVHYRTLEARPQLRREWSLSDLTVFPDDSDPPMYYVSSEDGLHTAHRVEDEGHSQVFRRGQDRGDGYEYTGYENSYEYLNGNTGYERSHEYLHSNTGYESSQTSETDRAVPVQQQLLQSRSTRIPDGPAANQRGSGRGSLMKNVTNTMGHGNKSQYNKPSGVEKNSNGQNASPVNMGRGQYLKLQQAQVPGISRLDTNMRAQISSPVIPRNNGPNFGTGRGGPFSPISNRSQGSPSPGYGIGYQRPYSSQRSFNSYYNENYSPESQNNRPSSSMGRGRMQSMSPRNTHQVIPVQSQFPGYSDFEDDNTQCGKFNRGNKQSNNKGRGVLLKALLDRKTIPNQPGHIYNQNNIQHRPNSQGHRGQTQEQNQNIQMNGNFQFHHRNGQNNEHSQSQTLQMKENAQGRFHNKRQFENQTSYNRENSQDQNNYIKENSHVPRGVTIQTVSPQKLAGRGARIQALRAKLITDSSQN